MIHANYGNVNSRAYASMWQSQSNVRAESKSFADTVAQADGNQTAQTVKQHDGRIAESMRKHPEYAKDWKREIENGHRLAKTYPPTKSRDEMSMKEYKSYIGSVIDRIPTDYSRSTTETSIHISDEAWETMKEDPDFEAYVLGGIEDIFTFHNPWMSPPMVKRYEVLQFGVPMENFRGQSWGDMTFGGAKNAQSHFDTLSKGESYHKKSDAQAMKQVEQRRQERKRAEKKQLEKEYEEQRRAHLEFEKAFTKQSAFVGSGVLSAYEMMQGM